MALRAGERRVPRPVGLRDRATSAARPCARCLTCGRPFATARGACRPAARWHRRRFVPSLRRAPCSASGSRRAGGLPDLLYFLALSHGAERSSLRKNAHMAKLIYSTIASLDGYVADADGNFDWAAPDEEVHAFVNDLERTIGTYLYGRRMYETMVYWETGRRPTAAGDAGLRPHLASGRQGRVLQDARRGVERGPASSGLRPRSGAADEGGAAATSALGARPRGAAIAAGLVDEFQLFVTPSSSGAARPPSPDVRWSSSCWTSDASPAVLCTPATDWRTPPSPARPRCRSPSRSPTPSCLA